MKTLKTLLLISTCFTSLLHAQDVTYHDFSVVQQNNFIYIRWKIDAGSLCNGIQVLRSTDAQTDLVIGEIDGVCGNSSSVKEYSVVDTEPVLNTTNTYQLVFGFSQYSEERSVFVKYLDPEKLYISPNPIETTMNLEWNDFFHFNYTVQLLTIDGSVCHSASTIVGNSYSLDISDLPAGCYYVLLIDEEGKTRTEKLIKF